MAQATPLIEPQNDERDTIPPRPRSAANSEKESYNIQKRPRRSVWLDSWLFEWITLVFSIACFIAIAVVLYIYDGKVRPEMPNRISLNTIVSVLGTGCRSSLILVVGEAISQLKWLWFQDPPNRQGQLAGMQRFDATSRGPLGSLMIIFHHRACSLVSLGAAVVVLVLAFDPFIQQLIDYPIQSTIDTNSGTTHALAPQLRRLGYISAMSDSGVDDAYTQGYFNSHNDFKVNPSCSSGNCTWEEFSCVLISPPTPDSIVIPRQPNPSTRVVGYHC